MERATAFICIGEAIMLIWRVLQRSFIIDEAIMEPLCYMECAAAFVYVDEVIMLI